MRKELPKVYEPQEVESRIYETWEKNGCFKRPSGPVEKTLHHRHCRPPT